MKNIYCFVLKNVYKQSQKYDDGFVPKDNLIGLGCSESLLTHLEFQHYLDYQRKDKKDFYRISYFGINYLHKNKREKANIILTFIAAVTSVIGLITTVISIIKC